MARRLSRLGFGVVGYNRSPEATVDLEKDGVIGAFSLKELVEKLKPPRIVWLMLPHQNIDEVLFGEGGLAQILEEGDYIVDGGNTYFEETVRRYQKIEDRNLNFIDVGISGGPGGALNGACLMIGGKKKIFTYLEPLFFSLAVRDGYQFFPGKGAGHFVKMVHNGIEYGMMQAIAEGFSLLKIADFKLDLTRAADVYNHGSVIESRLIGWLKEAFIKHSEGLDDISGVVEHTGEGEWTVKFAEKVNVKVSVINDAFNFRIDSKENPDYTGKILSALREQFGGHKVTL